MSIAPDRLYHYGGVPVDSAVDVQGYDDLSDAISGIGTTETTLVISNEQTVSTDETVPATMSLRFLRGGSLSIDTGKTVTINGPIDAGIWQIFSGDGSVAGTPLIDFCYPEWFGAVYGDDTVDNQPFIESCLSWAGKADLTGEGIYYTSTTIVLQNDERLRLSGAVSQISGDTAPVIQVLGYRTRIEGMGKDNRVSCTVVCSAGIIRIGHLTKVDTTEVTYNVLEGIRIVGPLTGADAEDVGLYYFNSEAWGAGGTSRNYFSSVRNIEVWFVDTGILVTNGCNGHIIRDIQFKQVSTYGYHIFAPQAADTVGAQYGMNWTTDNGDYECAENTFGASFMDYGPGMVMLKIQYYVVFNHWYGIQGEPGPDVANGYEIDASAVDCMVHGHFNVTNQGYNNSPTSSVFTKGAVDNLGVGDGVWEGYQKKIMAGSSASNSVDINVTMYDPGTDRHSCGMIKLSAVLADAGGATPYVIKSCYYFDVYDSGITNEATLTSDVSGVTPGISDSGVVFIINLDIGTPVDNCTAEIEVLQTYYTRVGTITMTDG